jgi:threonine/homoserine/homoserine lactone efflux protein
MDPLLAVLSILAAITVGAVSPGPSFVLVARVAVARSRADGLAAAIGMGVGGVILGGLALLGLQALLAQAGWLALALKIAGGLYLLYLAAMIWRGADAPVAVEAAPSPDAAGLGRSFALALATQISNPKAIAVYGSIFAALLPPAIPALVFSAERPRAAYLRSRRWVDRLAAAVMGALGLRLIAEAA